MATSKKEEKDARELPTRQYEGLSLYDFMPALSGGELAAPYHLSTYVDVLESLAGGSVRACIACPPQVGKTSSALYAIALHLLRNPKLKVAYASHAQTFSDTQSRIVRDLFERSGGQMGSTSTVKEWVTEQGGGFYSTSWEGSLIGRRVDILICDDLIKDAAMADSSDQRDQIQRWFDGVAIQRMWVGGSVLVIGSRWHPDDLTGRLLAKGWREICLPAVREDEDGTEHSIWPDVKPLSFFDDLRMPSSANYIGEHAWNAAYMGRPVPREGTLFGPAHFYDELPIGASPVMWGFDMATSASKHSDFSCAVLLFEYRGLYYVHDVRRRRQVVSDVEVMLHEMQKDYVLPVASYVSGQERAVFDLLFYRGIEIHRMPARSSKWARSQRAGIAWKAGRIMVRRGQPWTNAFVREVEYFTGQEDAHDDQVDALVSAYDYHAMNAPVGWANEHGFKFGRVDE